MDCLEYLLSVSNRLVLTPNEEESILRSLNFLSKNISEKFGDRVDDKFTIGSYSRSTILPRNVNENSDIDFLIVFKDGEVYKPQSLINRLRVFVRKYYPNSNSSQDFPTIVLDLNHIRFELIPSYFDNGIFGFGSSYKIPSKASNYSKWISTDPNKYNKKLIDKNESYSELLIPVIRLMKYWNISSGYPFNSFELEMSIINSSHVRKENLCSLFFECITDLDDSELSKEGKLKLEKAKNIVKLIKESLKKKVPELALYGTKLLIPELNVK